MGLIRLVTFLLILWVVWFMVRNYLRKVQSQRAQPPLPKGGRIVKCSYCDVHLPEEAALRHDAAWFCTAAHRQAFLASGNKSS